MREITNDAGLVACCGLYCGACRSYLKEKCEGCMKNEKASWCKVRSCCINKGISSCASCDEFSDALGCKKFNNFVSKIFSLVLGSDRQACINQIKELGVEGHAEKMSGLKLQSLKKKR